MLAGTRQPTSTALLAPYALCSRVPLRTFDFVLVALRVAQEQGGRLAVQRVRRVWIRQQLRQEDLDHVHEVYLSSNTQGLLPAVRLGGDNAQPQWGGTVVP